jgi:glucose-6-phosphate dehydrogenase assembly protein OpcA
MTQSPPLLSLQHPKDVSLEEIEAELDQIWQANRTGEDGALATRATTFTMIIYEAEGKPQENQMAREVEAELAGIPVEAGDIPGDLISLRLSSTNLKADCCTVLCSETTGCMRMEAGGGAQSCRIQQVTPLFDQKTEQLLTKQLQRGGREVLYEESMKLTYEMLKRKSEFKAK